MCLSLEALKVLRTSEFLPYVVFIEAPDYEVLKAMNRSAIESGVVTKQLTVSSCSFKTLETLTDSVSVSDVMYFKTTIKFHHILIRM